MKISGAADAAAAAASRTDMNNNKTCPDISGRAACVLFDVSLLYIGIKTYNSSWIAKIRWSHLNEDWNILSVFFRDQGNRL